MKIKQLSFNQSAVVEREWNTHRSECGLFTAEIQEYPNKSYVMCYYGDEDGRSSFICVGEDTAPTLDEAKVVAQRIFEEFITNTYLDK